ncbi:MFS transporter [Ruminococcaceae bacterium OttesenSCG-928-D13]|nr:MFS transporter [Ruminococcaceae bacterium OttesenSCG-928-D13]
MEKKQMLLNSADEKFSKKKAFGFALSRASSIISSLIIGQITYFGTNSLGLAAAAIAGGMAFKTALDAVTDLIMAFIIDRTHSKWGKARPYTLAGALVSLCVIAIFAVPTSWFDGMSQAAKNTAIVIYITVFATLASAVFETMRGVAFDTHLRRSIVNADNRIKVMTVGGIVYSVGSLAIQAGLPSFLKQLCAASPLQTICYFMLKKDELNSTRLSMVFFQNYWMVASIAQQ